MVHALVLASALLGAPQEPSPDPGVGCKWSSRWEEVASAAGRATAGRVGPDTPPKRRKGSLTRPRPNPGESFTLEGPWQIELVVSSEGRVLDAKVLRSASTPPWPRYESALVKSLLKWRYEPARVNGVPVGTCVTLSVQDR